MPAVALALAVRLWHDYGAGRAMSVSQIEQRGRAHPEDEEAQLDWGNALHAQHRDAEAEAALKTAAQLAPADPRPLNALAMLAMAHQQPVQALAYFHASLQLDPESADIWRSAGLLLQQQRDTGSAMEAFEQATRLDPKDAVSWRELGGLEHARNAPARGIEDLQRAVALAPDDLVAQDMLGDYALADGKLDLAGQAFSRALALRPSDPDALVGSARVTLQTDASPAGLSRAGKQIAQALAARPSAKAYLARGQWNLAERRYPAAVADLKVALRKDPGQTTAHSFLSRAYAGLGQAQMARSEAGAYTAASDAARRQNGSEPPRGPGR
ncbi:MAG TPA: tetratricopeptide repeat protein [Chthonomonadaceae bacterium]|nr:tetratricopeptide repeat protein [Chthonomonadaceae bacterium]